MMARALDPTELDRLQDLLLSRTGLSFPESRLTDLRAGLERAMARTGAADFDDFVRRLDSDRAAYDALIADITVTETYFFREPRQFEVLRRLVLPDLREHLPTFGSLRVWSAGCATGEEPYSLAILLEQEGLAEVAGILATDISRAALTRARAASYGTWSLRGNDDGLAARCFERHGDHFQLHERFRRRVDFRYLNLASADYPSLETGTAESDLIFCRNVLIYFDRETVRRVAERFFRALRNGGWLITGPSDPPLWEHAPFRTVVTAAGIFYQRDADSAGPRMSFTPVAAAPVSPPPPVVASLAEMAPLPVAAPTPVTKRVVEAATDDAQRWIDRVRGLADRGAARQAETEVVAALDAFPLDPELHYLKAIVLAELGRLDDAAAALRAAIYLGPDLAMAHFMLATIQQGKGATAAARRGYQAALDLCLRLPADSIVPLTDAEPVSRLIAAARAQIARLGNAER
jgi:chemotaxis protein methyltransferase CheR